MREQILARLKALYPGVNLSKARMDALADKLAPKITKEEDIDGQLTMLNDVMPFADIAKQDDRLRTLEARTKPDPKPAPQDPPAPGKTEPPTDDDAPPKWAVGLIQTVQKLQSEKVETSIRQKISTHEKVKDIPQSFWNGRTVPQKEEELEAFAVQIETDYNALKQDLANKGFAQGTTPKSGIGAASAEAKNIEADIKAWSQQGQAQDTKK